MPSVSASGASRVVIRIIAALARKAYRRPVTSADLEPILAFYRTARDARGFEEGIEVALQDGLVKVVAPQAYLFQAIGRDRHLFHLRGGHPQAIGGRFKCTGD